MALAVPLGLLALWELLARLAVVSPRYFPPPSRVSTALLNSFTEGDLGGETLVTLTRLALAFALAAVPAVPLGLLMGMVRPVREAVEPYIAVLFPVPKIALLPFLMILLGVGEPAFVLTGAISAFFHRGRRVHRGQVRTRPPRLPALADAQHPPDVRRLRAGGGARPAAHSGPAWAAGANAGVAGGSRPIVTTQRGGPS